MIQKIAQRISKCGNHKLVTKHFQRNLDDVKTKSAYVDNKLYYREWIVEGYNKAVRYFQTYSRKGIPFKHSKGKLDYYT